MAERCPKCKAKLKHRDKTVIMCRRCGYRKDLPEDNFTKTLMYGPTYGKGRFL